MAQSSVKWLPAPVPGLEVVPVGDRVLAELPAQIDLLTVADRREVDQAAVDVAHYDAGLLEGGEQTSHLQEGLPDLPSGIAAAVRRCGVREQFVGVLVDEQ